MSVEVTPWELGQLRKADRLTEWDGPVYLEDYGPDDGHFQDLELFEDYWFEDEPLTKKIAPYVWPGKLVPFRINAQLVLENALELHQECIEGENYCLEDLKDVNEVSEFFAAWCAKQDIPLYEPDYSRVVVLDAAAFEDLIK